MYEKVAELTGIVRNQLKKKPILYVVILGAAITRLLAVLFSTYLILWINVNMMADDMSEAEKKEKSSAAKSIYINIMVASALICVFVLPIIGKVCDVIDPRKIMPFAFMARCGTTYMFWLLTSPESF